MRAQAWGGVGCSRRSTRSGSMASHCGSAGGFWWCAGGRTSTHASVCGGRHWHPGITTTTLVQKGKQDTFCYPHPPTHPPPKHPRRTSNKPSGGTPTPTGGKKKETQSVCASFPKYRWCNARAESQWIVRLADSRTYNTPLLNKVVYNLSISPDNRVVIQRAPSVSFIHTGSTAVLWFRDKVLFLLA
jgi:hypothetical protein